MRDGRAVGAVRRGLVLTGLGLALGQTVLTACSDGSGSDNNVELQVTNETTRDDLNARVTTPDLTQIDALRAGPSDGRPDWTLFAVELAEGDVVQFSIRTDAGVEVAAGSCTVSDADFLGYARASYLGGTTVACDCGFEGTTGCEPEEE
ncbi:MAG: hypothetical protein MUC69_08270 [Gemmatimonadales bacterium]|jgi:hypothetical protein|nr:hypothetical protein [Gemmatimonadales bacterium]